MLCHVAKQWIAPARAARNNSTTFVDRITRHKDRPAIALKEELGRRVKILLDHPRLVEVKRVDAFNTVREGAGGIGEGKVRSPASGCRIVFVE
jgi:intein/homing endonuclease